MRQCVDKTLASDDLRLETVREIIFKCLCFGGRDDHVTVYSLLFAARCFQFLRSTAFASKVIIISHYARVCNYFFSLKQNRESHVCPLKTASDHVAVKYGMNGTLLLVLVN